MSCKGIWVRHKAARPVTGGGYRYAANQKRCQVWRFECYDVTDLNNPSVSVLYDPISRDLLIHPFRRIVQIHPSVA